MALREEARDERIGAACVKHRYQPRCFEHPKSSPVRAIACQAIELPDHIRRPESCDRRLLTCPRAAGCLTIRLDLVECLHPLAALKRGRRIREKLIGALQDEGP